MIEARKISTEEAWNSSIIFFLDDELEKEIESEVDSLLKTARAQTSTELSVHNIARFLVQQSDGLDVLLKDLELSQEKFMRIVSLLRKLGRIPGGFNKEWSIVKVKKKIITDHNFASTVAALLFDGKRDQELQNYIPRYYLDALNYRETQPNSEASLRRLYKRQLIGTYGAKKGHRVEDRIRQKLSSIEAKYGVSHAKGRSRMIETDIDFAIPTLDDPWVIIMSSFQETTSSGQTTKARDMLSAYERVLRNNSRYGEKRVFINFVDGGGWLARQRDFQRLVQQCDYFINFHYLDMLEAIVVKHVPRKYFRRIK